MSVAGGFEDWDPQAEAAGWYDQEFSLGDDRELRMQERQIRYEADVRQGFPLGRYAPPPGPGSRW